VIEEFLKNPIGYYGHDKEDGVLLKWEDLHLDGDRVIGKPTINLAHPRAQRTIDEINDGFLNAASVGKICVLEYELEDNPEDPEEPIVVATKWYNKECSMVDNPGNRSAMKVELFDGEGNELNPFQKQKAKIKKQKHTDNNDKIINNQTMAKITVPVTPELLSLLNLSDDATAEAVMAGIRGLHGENTALRTAKEKAETDLADHVKTVAGEKVKSMLNAALAAGKINAKTRVRLETRFADNPADLADMFADMPAYIPVADRINKLPEVVKNLADKTYQEIDKAGKIKLLKEHAPELYAEKLKAFKESKK
jgi:hypothetical protein